jgi:hypothetical protein
LTKITAEKMPDFKGLSGTSTDIEFTNIEKEEIALLEKQEPVKISFKYKITYENKEQKKPEKLAEVTFEGFVVLSSEKEESKEIMKSWKKKELPISFKVPIFNIILKKCAVKALQLEEDVGIPTHFTFPQILQKPSEKKD